MRKKFFSILVAVLSVCFIANLASCTIKATISDDKTESESVSEGISETESESVSEPEIEEEAYTIDGEYIYFGSYPQTEVKDSAIKSSLNSLAGTLPQNGNNRNWTSYKYYKGNGNDGSQSNSEDFIWYIDISYSGEKYRGVYFTIYRPYWTSYSSSTGNTYQDDNGYNTGNVYWFKYEPIKWTILIESVEDGKKYAKLLCDIAIDSQEYYHSYEERTISERTVYQNNYAYSNIRAWLNDNFYNTAFNSLQQALIQTVEVDNSARSTNPDNNATQWDGGNNLYACENTYDKVWLLSMEEVTTADYGFDISVNRSTTRIKMSSDYAKSQGCFKYKNADCVGACGWWLRSPYNFDSCNAYGIGGWGDAYNNGIVTITSNGIVPALKIAL